MRFFAQIDDDYRVVKVECVNDQDCQGANLEFSEAIGIAFLQHLFGGALYVETRDEEGFRGGLIATPGFTWDPTAQRFYPQKPDPEALWDDEANAWLIPFDGIPQP